MPIFDIELQDFVNNEGEAYYNNHLAKPEGVTVVMEALDGEDIVVSTYNINVDIAYVLGPSYTGHVSIRNCALPGERIAFASDGITVTTSDQMPITETGWKLCPKGDIPGTCDAINAIDIPHAQYDSDLSGGATVGWVNALSQYAGWNIAYTFKAGTRTFTVLPSQSAENEYERYILIHNYFDMQHLWECRNNVKTKLVPYAGARIYIRNREGWDAFVNYLNAATSTYTDAEGEHAGNTLGIPEGMAGMKVYLQSDIILPAVPSITQAFKGEFNGDGYHITIPSGSLFGGHLDDEAKIYNLGVVGGTIADGAEGKMENCFVATDADEFKYARKSYKLT